MTKQKIISVELFDDGDSIDHATVEVVASSNGKEEGFLVQTVNGEYSSSKGCWITSGSTDGDLMDGDCPDFDIGEIVGAAEEFLEKIIKLNELYDELKDRMSQTFDDITSDSNNVVIKKSEVGQIFDDELNSFMIENFDIDYSDNDNAMEFYNTNACDIRFDFEIELGEWLDENAESNPRIVLDGF